MYVSKPRSNSYLESSRRSSLDSVDQINEANEASERATRYNLHESKILLQIASTLEIPPNAKEQLCRDYFLDFVTHSTPLKECSHPLAAVAKTAVARLSLGSCLYGDADKRLVTFAVQIEEGYPVELYHSRAHAADVSNRLAALLTKTGIAQCTSKNNSVLMLASIVAALIHDYKHPQVSNNFLIEQVR